MNEMIFNYALLPNPAFACELEKASRAMGATVPLTYALGAHSLPHVTILQFEGTRAQAPELWQ